ncbi:MAG: hypothetical protein GY845_12485 [Planctomycetes bacterium]|nr:hypothetical protein [Planctomycetota bacterium]
MIQRLYQMAVLVALLVCVPMLKGFTQTNAKRAANCGITNTTMNENSLNDLSWLVGRWEGNAFGGTCEETWNPPSGGTMVGTFKLAVDGVISFYELAILSIEGGGPTLRLKHFHSDLTGWEEKDEMITFPFVKMTNNELQLEGLTYRSLSVDSLQMEVSLQNDEGNVKVVVITCARAGSATENTTAIIED